MHMQFHTENVCNKVFVTLKINFTGKDLKSQSNSSETLVSGLSS